MINSTSKNIILNLINKEESENYIEIADIEKQIKSLKVKQEKLLDMKLDELINEKQYILKYNFLENEIKDCLEQKLKLENNNISKKTQILFELLQTLYLNYSTTSKEWKSYIIKKLMFELLIDKGKRLQIAENQLFKTLKILEIAFGITKGFDVWTFKENLSRVDLDELREFYEFVKNWNL